MVTNLLNNIPPFRSYLTRNPNIGRQVKSFRKAKLVVKPKEKDICPRYQPQSIPSMSASRNRSTTGRIDGADRPKQAPTKVAPKATQPAIATVKQTRPLSSDRLRVSTVARDRSRTDKRKPFGTSV